MSGLVKGDLAAAQRTLARMGPEAVKALEDALSKGAEEIAARARALAPEDEDGVRPATITIKGRTYPRQVLKESIKVRAPRLGLLGRGKTSRARVFAEVVSTDPKAGLIEFGRQGKLAQPFFFVAVRGLRKRVTARVRRALRQAAKAAMARGGGGG